MEYIREVVIHVWLTRNSGAFVDLGMPSPVFGAVSQCYQGSELGKCVGAC